MTLARIFTYFSLQSCVIIVTPVEDTLYNVSRVDIQALLQKSRVIKRSFVCFVLRGCSLYFICYRFYDVSLYSNACDNAILFLILIRCTILCTSVARIKSCKFSRFVRLLISLACSMISRARFAWPLGSKAWNNNPLLQKSLAFLFCPVNVTVGMHHQRVFSAVSVAAASGERARVAEISARYRIRKKRS